MNVKRTFMEQIQVQLDYFNSNCIIYETTLYEREKIEKLFDEILNKK